MLLAIDTAGSRCAACLYDPAEARLLTRSDPDIGKGHAEYLMDEIAGLLAEVGARYEDLAKLAVVVGPGSFTGLRVGVAAVRGLALALSIPAVGVGTLEALAEPHRREGVPVLSILDAKRGEVYAALYAPDGTEMRAPAAFGPDTLAHFLSDLTEDTRLIAAGSGAAIAEAALGSRWRVEAAGERHCDIAAVARIAAARGPTGSPTPLYLRGADAKPSSRPAIARTLDEPAAGGLSIAEGTFG